MTQTIRATMRVGQDGQATMAAGDLAPGEYAAVVQVTMPSAGPQPVSDSLLPPARNRGFNPNDTFRREDMYGDDGR